MDDWDTAINTLATWSVLLPSVAIAFRRLRDVRHCAIHFRPEVDSDAKPLALQALTELVAIIEEQFGSVVAGQPWFIAEIPYETYLRQTWEDKPFIREVYIPNCAYVGPNHSLEWNGGGWDVYDGAPYRGASVSDEEFAELRRRHRQ